MMTNEEASEILMGSADPREEHRRWFQRFLNRLLTAYDQRRVVVHGPPKWVRCGAFTGADEYIYTVSVIVPHGAPLMPPEPKQIIPNWP